VWGKFPSNATAQDVSTLISAFGIGSLALMDQNNPKDVAPGNVVYSGKRVSLKLRGEYLVLLPLSLLFSPPPHRFLEKPGIILLGSSGISRLTWI
jgi:hypothetical protein